MRIFRGKFRLTRRDWVVAVISAVLVLLVVKGVSVLSSNATLVPYQPAGITAAWVPDTVKHWSGTINEMAKKYDIDPNLVAIIITMESGGNAKAKSEAGAQGLMQIMPATGSDIARKYVKEPVGKYDLLDPKTNIEFGTAYLAFLRDYFTTDQPGPDSIATVELIAAGYNGGPGTAAALEKGEGLRDTQPVIYSRDAFNMWRERVSKTSPTFDRWKERGGSSLLTAATASQN